MVEGRIEGKIKAVLETPATPPHKLASLSPTGSSHPGAKQRPSVCTGRHQTVQHQWRPHPASVNSLHYVLLYIAKHYIDTLSKCTPISQNIKTTQVKWTLPILKSLWCKVWLGSFDLHVIVCFYYPPKHHWKPNAPHKVISVRLFLNKSLYYCC